MIYAVCFGLVSLSSISNLLKVSKRNLMQLKEYKYPNDLQQMINDNNEDCIVEISKTTKPFGCVEIRKGLMKKTNYGSTSFMWYLESLFKKITYPDLNISDVITFYGKHDYHSHICNGIMLDLVDYILFDKDITCIINNKKNTIDKQNNIIEYCKNIFKQNDTSFKLFIQYDEQETLELITNLVDHNKKTYLLVHKMNIEWCLTPSYYIESISDNEYSLICHHSQQDMNRAFAHLSIIVISLIGCVVCTVLQI